ncbi:SEC-C domain-containing protein [Pseudomonas protegens]|uniref:SEC-C domain-containing protein n=1 Tax=Pseudomonas protegens TaxID=380021 RepID=UPI0027524CD5|nr:SEC-C domain-containing protein [Pseudomonas protegens]MDP9502755.1 SEC-C domain-containing protein [Pseudomonas protegens]
MAENTFLSLWSYPSLFRDVGGGKELIDLTIYFDNNLILFSDKGHVKYKESNPTDLAWKRWYRDAVKESAKQLYAAEKFVRNMPKEIYTNNRREDEFPFDISKGNLRIHLIAVTRGIGKAAKEYFDSYCKGSAGTLSYAYRLSEKEILETPFFVGDIDPSKTFVHVLDESGIELLLNELNTPSDFIRYLSCKEKAVRELGLVASAGEEETLSYYLQEDGGYGFGDIPNLTPDRQQNFSIPELEWEYYKKTVDYALRYNRKKKAARWNELIARFSDSIVDGVVAEGKDLPFLTHASAVEALASENMYSRSILTEQLFDKYETVPTFSRSARVVPSQTNTDRLYIFLFYPWSERFNSYDDYRRERTECMHVYALVAMYKYQNFKQVVVLGAATKGSSGESETIIVIDATVPLTAEQRKDAQHVMKTLNVLNDLTNKKLARSERVKGSARNEPCPCGSGRKFKKCCS